MGAPSGRTAVDVDRLAGELRIVLGRLIRLLRSQYGFGLTQSAVLGRLDRDGPRSIGELAGAERIRPQSMSQTLAELEAEGLVARGPDPSDGRRTQVALTDHGRAVLQEDRALRVGWLAKAITDELTEDERVVLDDAVRLLGRLSELEA